MKKKNQISIIVGMGEVGRALKEILSPYYQIVSVDLENKNQKVKGDYLHICFPYSKNFISEVKKYQKLYCPRYTIIHSTIPVGTSSKLNACHSPIRGRHPYLAESIKKFIKLVGGKGASEIADYFRYAGLRVLVFDKAETTEAAKLFDTEYYRLCIEFALKVKKYCDKNNLNFHEVYTLPNQTYNEGYLKMGNPEYQRPILQPLMKKIGGHCILQNKKLIKY